MKPIMIIAIAVALSSAMVFAADQNSRREKIREAVLKKYDANGNGELDENERAVVLKTFDANGNGMLDRDEKLALAKGLRNRQEPQQNGDGDGGQRGVASSKWNTVGFQQANTMGGGEADIPKTGVFRVFVLMGQSNMHGTARSAELKSPYNKKHERIRIWANGRWEYFQPRARFGPGVSMAHQLAKEWPHDTIGIIKISSGGTGIRAFEKNWTKERADRTFDGRKGSLYQDLMNAADEAKKISNPEFRGFVWKQGAADGTKQDLANEYYDTFKQLVSDLRTDLVDADLPVFVLTYRNDDDLAKLAKIKKPAGRRAYIGTVLMAHNRAGRDIPNVAIVHHGKLPTNADGVHFNAEGQLKLGKMTASAIEDFYQAKE